MSENLRMAAIVLVFVVLGAILWGFVSRTSDEPTVEQIAETPELKHRVAAVPEFDFDDAPDHRAAEQTDVLDHGEIDEAEVDAEDSTEKSGSTKRKARGTGKIDGEVTMTDGADIPDDLVVTLHFVPDNARYDGATNTVHATTAVDGEAKFNFEKLPMGQYVLFGQSADYTGTSNRTLSVGGREYTVGLSLYPAASISGSVVNDSGEALSDAHVFVAGYLSGGSDLKADLYRSRASGVSANENGEYVMVNLQVRTPALQYRLLAMAPGYAPKITELYPTAANDVQIVLSEGGNVSGTVVNLATGGTMPNVPISATADFAMATKEMRTDENGAFVFEGLSSGTHHFDVKQENLVVSSESLSLEVSAAQVIDDLLINVQVGAMVAGRVYDSDTDVGVADVTISARPVDIPVAERKETKTDANGYYLIQGMHAGNYRVEYSEIKNYPRDKSWEDRKEVVTALGQRLAGVDFSVAQGLSVSGTVVDTRGDPINQAWVNGSIRNGNTRDSGQSGESGNFSIYGFNPNTTVSLNVSANEFARELKSVKIENESVSGVRIVMDPEGKISGVVVDASGRPLPSVSLYARDKGSNEWGGSSDDSNAQGEFELERLKAGTYFIKPSVNNSYSSNDPTLETVTLARGQHLEGVRIVWRERDGSYQISGNVTDDLGDVISGARVFAYGRGAGGQIQGTSGPEGNYVLPNLEEGSYTLNFQSQKHTPQNLQQIEAGSTNASVVMTRTGSITGTIVDGLTGDPVTDFNLLLLNGQYQSHMEQQFKRYHHAEGEFSVDGAYPNQPVSIMVRATGYAETLVPVDGVRSGDTVSNVLVSMAGENTVNGVVVDQRGNRLSGASIFKGPIPRNEYERDRGVKARSDSNGEFTLGGLSRGEIVISAYLKGLSSDTQTVNIGSGNNRVQFVLPEGASVEGVVTVDGVPAPNVSINGNIFNGENGQSGFNLRGTTDEDGRYLIGGLPGGRGSVQANLNQGGENRNMSAQIEVATGMTTEVNFPFESATSSVEGYIMISETEMGSGRVNLTINTGGNTESRFQEVSGDGYYLFESLPAGTVGLQGRGASMQRQKSVSAELGENENIRLDLKMYGGTTIHCLAANPPSGMVVFAAVLRGDTVVPTELDMGFFQMLGTTMVGQAQVTNGVGTIGGVENGSYLVLMVAYSGTADGVDFSTMRVATTPVVVQDQPELEVEVSF